jgi:uncharacterized membrane protein
MERYTSAVIAVLALGFVAFRLWGLSDQCLWFDEIFSVHAATQPWGNFFQFVSLDLIHPPLFYLVLKFWIAIGGEGMLWLRLLPVVFATLALLPFIGVCREMKLKHSTTIVALLLFAVNGSLIKYAQEVRMYSVLLFLSLLSIWLFLRYFNKGKGFVALVIVNILLVYTHYYGWFVITAEMAAIIIFQRAKLRQALLMYGVVTLSFVPWAMTIYRAASGGSDIGQNIGWIEPPGVGSILTFLFNLVEPFYFQMSSVEPGSLYIFSIPLLMLIAYAKMRYLLRWLSAEDKRQTYLLEVMIGVPIFLALAISWLTPYSVWGSRHLIIVYAPLLILTALFLTELQKSLERRVVLGLTGAVILLSFVAYAIKPTTEQPWCYWENAAQSIVASDVVTKSDGEPTAIYAFEDLTAYQLWFALRKNPEYRVYKVEGVDGLVEDKAYFLPRGFDEVKTVDIAAVAEPKIWLAFRSPKITEKEPPLRNFLIGGYRVVSTEIKQIGREEAGFVLLEK